MYIYIGIYRENIDIYIHTHTHAQTHTYTHKSVYIGIYIGICNTGGGGRRRKRSTQRLRPILMTSLATLFGLLPMALKMGEGGESYAPLATAILGGLSVSLFLTVFVVPAAYLLVERRSGFTDRSRQGETNAVSV